jgi:hypothetical protein
METTRPRPTQSAPVLHVLVCGSGAGLDNFLWGYFKRNSCHADELFIGRTKARTSISNSLLLLDSFEHESINDDIHGMAMKYTMYSLVPQQ